MKSIQGIRCGNVVNLSIDGKLHKKNCVTSKEADELFRAILIAKDNPTDENIKVLRCLLSEKLRVALLAGLETDPDNGEVYLAGFNTPVPLTLIEVIKEYHENGYPLEAIINFWKLLMINPDVNIRTSLFDFIVTHDFVLTDNGYMLVYKAVAYGERCKAEQAFEEFISNQYFHVKKDWKCSPNKYMVYINLSDDSYGISKVESIVNWNEEDRGIDILGKLGDIFDNIFNGEKTGRENTPTYTDKHTGKMIIQLGTPVVMERKECDGDSTIDCSYGLHVGSTKYVQTFANNNDTVLVCLVNPANVVAVPNYDHSKMRVSEYFPFAVATYVDGKIDIVDESYFESDYIEYELSELERQIAKVKLNELPIETAKNVEKEERPMSELLKILESRLIDIEEY